MCAGARACVQVHVCVCVVCRCTCVYAGARVCTGARACVQVHMLAKLECCPQVLSTLFYEAGSLSLEFSDSARLADPQTPPSQVSMPLGF